MRLDNPAGMSCDNIERGTGIHEWIRRADGTASCMACGMRLNANQTSDLFADEDDHQINKKAAKSKA